MTEYWKSIPHDLFDYASFYDEVSERMPDNCRLAEVGNADGSSAIYLAEKMTSIGKTFTLRMIDNLDYGRTDQLSILYENVYKSGLSERINIIPFDSLNASLKFPDNYFDFVFIDSGHTLELTKAEIRLWIRKVKEGGILAGHDYLSKENPGVRDAVNEVLHGYEGLVFHETAKGYCVWEIHKNHFETPL